MRGKLSVLFLLCLATLSLIQSASSAEAIKDNEKGNDHEVKSKNKDGRQFLVAPLDTDQPNLRKKPPVVYTTPTTPATGVDTATSVDETDGEGHIQGVDVVENIDGSEPAEAEEEPKPEGEAEAGDDGNIDYQTGAVDPNLPTTTSANTGAVNTPTSTAASTGSGAEGADNEANAAIVENNGIVVVHTDSNKPPQVNPDTHAVFQLVPVQPAHPHEVGVYVGDGDELHYEEEISPVSTTAIWSTGDDPYDDYGVSAAPSKKKPAKVSNKPTKGNKNKNKKRPNKNKNKNKKRPNKNKNKKGNKHRRPGNKNRRPLSNKHRTGNNNNKRRRLPVHSSSHSNNHNYDNRRNYGHRQTANQNRQHHFNTNAHRRLNANLANRDINRRNKLNRNKVDKGTRTFTKTETMTQTGGPNDEKDVNYIYIRKDGTTTPRPFWQIWGRNAEGGAAAVADEAAVAQEDAKKTRFGNRKRANMHFVA